MANSSKSAENVQEYKNLVHNLSHVQSGVSRRQFLGTAGAATALAFVAGAEVASAVEVGPTNEQQRRNQAYQVRLQAALAAKNAPLANHATNGDDDLYPNKIGSFSKALPHDALGEVNLDSYGRYIAALSSGRGADFDAIPMGSTGKLVNPQSAYAFEMMGADSHHLSLRVPPALASAEETAEMAELYWQALTRDVPFADFNTSGLIASASANLSAFSDFRGPKVGSSVTADTLFRGNTPGDLTGPYLSQLLWKTVPYGLSAIEQRYRFAVPAIDFMTAYSEWLNIQNGAPPSQTTTLENTPRFMRSGRDLTEWVHRDFTYQAFLNAALILLSFGPGALDKANPYRTSSTQSAFITFGGPEILDLVARAAVCSLKAAWFQKWLLHRRLRPEAFAGLVHHTLTGSKSYPIHAELLTGPGAQVLQAIFSANGSYLLPMAYPEGSPAHPAYPAGHACIAGACATVLKWFFDESVLVPSPVVANSDGSALLPYSGALTIGGELNKLASNIAIGRDTAGVHWRSDGIEGLNLGETVAISILQDMRATHTETNSGLSLMKFDGTQIVL